jgi:hypothetical protein
MALAMVSSLYELSDDSVRGGAGSFTPIGMGRGSSRIPKSRSFGSIGSMGKINETVCSSVVRTVDNVLRMVVWRRLVIAVSDWIADFL